MLYPWVVHELVKPNYKVKVYFADIQEYIQDLRNWAKTTDDISLEGWEEFEEDE